MEPLALSIPDARKALGSVGKSTIYRLINAGKLTKAKIGNRTVITTASVKALLEEGIPS